VYIVNRGGLDYWEQTINKNGGIRVKLRIHDATVYTDIFLVVQPVVQPVVQRVASCIRGVSK